MTREQILEWCEERATLPYSYDDGGFTWTSSYHVREWPNGDRYADTYTRADWERSGTFNARPGQSITSDVYDEMLNCMPPYSLPRDLRRDGHTKGFLMSEPYSSDAHGLLYMAFVRHGLQHFYYGLVHR